MKFGVSTYSLYGALKTGEMNVLSVFDWTREHGGEHVEIVPIGYTLTGNPELIRQVREKSEQTGVAISNYAVSADFAKLTAAEFQSELERLYKEVDTAHQLGVTRMRHDVAWRSIEDNSIATFDEELPRLVEACEAVADYASSYGIVTSIENHGYYVQSADRVQRVVASVHRENFRTTLDVANFMCVDEDPFVSVKKNLEFASMVHLKDFYLRSGVNPGEGWFATAGGNYLRGAILGNGDVDLHRIVKLLKDSKYDGYVSIEFEGLEECRFATRVSLDNARRIYSEC